MKGKKTEIIGRDIAAALREAAGFYPVVTLLGPRLAGKTTLALACFPEYAYVNLEDPENRNLAKEDYKAFLKKFPEPLIIDEAQQAPELTSAIQVAVDADRRRNGRFILTGSHQPNLLHVVSQSLAGRTSILNLLPLSVSEILAGTPDVETDVLLYRGFMPELQVSAVSPTNYYRNYFRTYVERDLRRLVNVKDVAAFERFLTLLAGRVGQVLNLSSLSGDVGVTSTTLSGWLSILEASFIVFRLQPYFSNVSKRVVKTPKIYFTEPGLAVYLLGIETPEQLARDPLRGQLFENMVVADAMKQRMNCGREPNLFFLRTEKGFEIDLIVRRGRELTPIEIKSAMTCNRKFTENLVRFCVEEPEATSPMLLYDGDDVELSNGVSVKNFRSFSL